MYAGRRFCHCQRDSKDGIGSQLCLIWRAIQFDHDLVQGDLISGIKSDNGFANGLIDITHSVKHTFSTVAALIIIAQLDCLVSAG